MGQKMQVIGKKKMQFINQKLQVICQKKNLSHGPKKMQVIDTKNECYPQKRQVIKKKCENFTKYNA